MLIRIFVAILIAITFTSYAHADKSDSLFADHSVVVDSDDLKWGQLDGRSQGSTLPLTIRQIDELKIGQKLTDKETTYQEFLRISFLRNVSCMKTLGHARFCRCLGENLPYILTFEEYVAIVVGTKVNLDHLGMTGKEIKQMVNIVVETRERCVAKTIER